jgi:hypothetical protein
MANGEYVEGSYYFYAPSKGAAIFFAATFGASMVVHGLQCHRYKSWLLSGLWWFCCLLFTAGFATRIYGAWHYDNLPAFIASTCIIYAAPPLLELQNYHILGRILYYVPYHSPIHPGRVISTFAFVSAIVEILNGLGISYASNQALDDSLTDVGHALTKASLVLQLVVIACFVVLAAVFHARCARDGLTRNPRLRAPMLTLYVSVALITVRTVFRTVEYFGLATFKVGRTDAVNPATMTPLIRYEWFFYVFEASLMLLNVVMFNVLHPMRFLPRSNRVYLARDGATEVEGPGWHDKRPLFYTLVDPFNLAAIVDRKKTRNFWEDDGVPAQGEQKQ